MVRDVADRFHEVIGRRSGGLVSSYRLEDADVVLVGLGSLLGTAADVVDELRDGGSAVGVLGVTCFRPWPFDEVRDALARAPHVRGPEPRSLGGLRAASSARRCGSRSAAARAWCTTSSPGSGGRPVTRDLIRRLLDRCGRGRAVAPTTLTFADLDEAWQPRPRARPGAGSRGVTDDDRAQAVPGRHVRRGEPPAGPVRAHRAVHARTAPTRSPPDTGPAAAAARLWRPGSCSTPRCVPATGRWSR